MRRIIIWAMSTLSVVVLLFSYSTSHSATLTTAPASSPVVAAVKPDESTPTPAPTATTTPTTPAEPADPTDQADPTATTPTDTPSATASGSQTFAGDAAMTRFGAVQVQITVESGRITAASVLQVPYEDRHDQEINSRAVPVYNDEVVSAQSAQIDVVSGATVTWEGYTSSLQSAIDQANL